MKEKIEIKEKLLRGDRQAIASITGYSYIYVKKVLAFQRHNESIWKAAKKIVINRESLKKEFEA